MIAGCGGGGGTTTIAPKTPEVAPISLSWFDLGTSGGIAGATTDLTNTTDVARNVQVKIQVDGKVLNMVVTDLKDRREYHSGWTAATTLDPYDSCRISYDGGAHWEGQPTDPSTTGVTVGIPAGTTVKFQFCVGKG